MIEVLVLLAALAIGATAALYQFFPGRFYALAMAAERALAGLREDTVAAGGHDIALLRSPAGATGDTVVLLHGFGANHYHWPRLVRELRRRASSLRIIAPDLPGFGDSSRDRKARYGLDEQLERLHALFDRLQLDRFHVVGSSMGGHLAAAYLLRHRDRVRSITLIDAAGVTPQASTQFNQALDEGRNLLLTESRADFRRVTDLVFSRAPLVPPRVLDYLGDQSAANREWYARIFEQYLHSFQPLEAGAALPHDVPALIVWGEEDKVLPVEDVQVFHRLLPQAEVLLLPGTGHLPMLERPRAVAEACAGVLARTAKASDQPAVTEAT